VAVKVTGTYSLWAEHALAAEAQEVGSVVLVPPCERETCCTPEEKGKETHHTTHKLHSCRCSCMATFDYNALTSCKSATQGFAFLYSASPREREGCVRVCV
jgi:hypothetical protein